MGWPSLTGAVGRMLTTTVNVTVSPSGPVVVNGLRMSVQPNSAFERDSVLGKFTDATMLGFCKTKDADGRKYQIRKGHTVREIEDGGAVLRQWEVSDDPENYEGVYLVVPLRPSRTVR